MKFNSPISRQNLSKAHADEALAALEHSYGNNNKQGRIIFNVQDGNITGTDRSRGVTAGIQKISTSKEAEYAESKVILNDLMNASLGTKDVEYVSQAMAERRKNEGKKSNDVTPGLIRHLLAKREAKEAERAAVKKMAEDSMDLPVAYLMARVFAGGSTPNAKNMAKQQIRSALGQDDDSENPFEPDHKTLFTPATHTSGHDLFTRLCSKERKLSMIEKEFQRDPSLFMNTIATIEEEADTRQRSFTTSTLSRIVQQLTSKLHTAGKLEIQTTNLSKVNPEQWDAAKSLLCGVPLSEGKRKGQTLVADFKLPESEELDDPNKITGLADLHGTQLSNAEGFIREIRTAFAVLSKNQEFKALVDESTNHGNAWFRKNLEPYLSKLVTAGNVPREIQDSVWNKVGDVCRTSPDQLNAQ